MPKTRASSRSVAGSWAACPDCFGVQAARTMRSHPRHDASPRSTLRLSSPMSLLFPKNPKRFCRLAMMVRNPICRRH